MAHRNPSSNALLLGLALLTAGACANNAAAPSVERQAALQPPTEVVAEAPAAAEIPTDPPLLLTSSVHPSSMSEVVLDPSARSALTLDTEGNVRLWPSLDGQAGQPLALPMQEPAWMSIARAEDGLVMGFIDTSGGGQVVHVQVRDGEALMTTLFEIPTAGSLLEIHVMDGGERILALGYDHRLSLYDRQGQPRAVLEPKGFRPWQLRLQQVPGQAPALVAVLAAPTRIQPISVDLDEDTLALSGEARVIDIDQGPNRNDISLAPDGKTMVAMRRIKARSKRFTLEFIDLPTDERRLLAVKMDERERPRVHLVDDSRVLLESSSGKGFWVDWSQAVPWDKGTTREETEDVEDVETQPALSLPHSSEVRRMHTTVVAGVRAVPAGRLVLDPIDDPGHRELGAALMRPEVVAVDEDGSQVAWSDLNTVVLEDVDSGEPPRVLPAPDRTVTEMAFVGQGRLMTVSLNGNVAIIDGDGQVLSRTKVPLSWGMSATGFRRGSAFGQGTLGVLDQRPQHPIQVVDVGGGNFGELREAPRSQRTQWSQMGTRARDARSVVGALGFSEVEPHSLEALVEDSAGRHLVANDSTHPLLWQVSEESTRSLPLREGRVVRLEPSPDGERVVVVQRMRSSGAFDSFRAGSEGTVVSVYDIGAQQRLWSRATNGRVDVDWSFDGNRIGMASGDGGRIVDAQTGEELLRRTALSFSVDEIEDSSTQGS